MNGRQLVLIRHAEAAWETAGQSDFERPLTEDGERDAARLAEWLAARLPVPNRLMSSPAPRALATAERLAAAWANPPAIVLEAGLYEAPLDRLIGILRELPDRCHQVFVVGHNPSLSHAADWLIGEPTVLELAPGSLAWLSLDLPHWKDIQAGCARLHPPEARDLDGLLDVTGERPLGHPVVS